MFNIVLIANRGEIACRIIRACHELGVRAVAVYSEADKDSLHVKMADEAVCVGAATNTDSYLNMPNVLMAAVITGADRIAANGDTANKIGTYSLAVLAAAHGIPFYVAAPSSTFDLTIASGDQIPIEERSSSEVTRLGDRLLVPQGVSARNPAFDVTPAALVGAIVTERGVFRPPFEDFHARLTGSGSSP